MHRILNYLELCLNGGWKNFNIKEIEKKRNTTS